MLTNILVDTRPICRPIHLSSVSRYVYRYIGQGVHKIYMIPNLLVQAFSGQINLKLPQNKSSVGSLLKVLDDHGHPPYPLQDIHDSG